MKKDLQYYLLTAFMLIPGVYVISKSVEGEWAVVLIGCWAGLSMVIAAIIVKYLHG